MSGPHGSAFSGRVGWGRRPAVVVIDLVRAYTHPDGPFALPDARAASTRARVADTAGSASGSPNGPSGSV